MKYFSVLLVLLVCGLPLLAQPLSGSSKTEQLLIVADSSARIGSYANALEKYEEAYEQDDDLPLRPRIALMHLQLRDIKAANRTYRQVFRRSEATDTANNIHRYHYARALKMDGNYDDARTYFENFLLHNTDERLEQLAKLELEGIRLYRTAPTETGEVQLENLGRKVNGAFSEYRPMLDRSGSFLYYSTWKATETVQQDQGEEDDYSRVFRVSRKVNDKGEVEYGKPEPLAKEVNRPGLQTANPALSPDGRRLYYNRMRLESNTVAEAKIYFSEAEDDGWKSGNPVSGINGDHLALQPAPGELFGKEVLFFVSDMAGGYGGRDLYYAEYEGEGRYGTPVNLGPEINTIGDEGFPFYFEGTLYFSTDGRPTMGGYDLFYSAWDGSSWSLPENMGPGFNSTVDDKSLSVFGDGLLGFMTSNREGGRSVKSKTCCDDIYSFQIAAIYANLVVGLFSEAKEPLTTGAIELKTIVNGTPAGIGNRKQRDDGNRFDFGLDLEQVYQVVATHPGYYPDTVEINTLALEESKEIQQVFFLRAIPPPPPPEEAEVVVDQPIVLEELLYDFDDDEILPDAEPSLEYLASLMEEYPDMVIELGSHTDSRGRATYNQSLSQRRASSARKWLITKKGIAAGRIKTRGYGMAVPQTASARLASRIDFLQEGDVLTDDYINALPDEETRERAHRLNRRTEFKILEGPTSIKVRLDKIERQLPPAPDRGALPGTGKAMMTPIDTITPFSSLYGQEDITGLPVLQFSPREIDLGEVPHGETRAFSYTFTNTGTVPAQIMLIQACSCTSYTHDNSKVYAPGAQGTIEVVFDSAKKEDDEVITIDIFLEQTDKKEVPILEMVNYTYQLVR